MMKPMRTRWWVAAMSAVLLAAGAAATQSAQAQTFTVLYNFTGSTDGAYPYAGLVRDQAGNVYGTTDAGGASGYGVVFKVDSSGTETVLHSFTGGTTDGAFPFAGLIQDKSGNFYGTTIYGGASSAGTVFKVDSSGSETVLYSFAGGTTDGCYPYGGLVQDSSGNLYGTTSNCGAASKGTVFKVDSSGTETVLHSFAGGASDGAFPFYASLRMDTKGNLYGVTLRGGAGGYGTVFKLSKSATVTVLHSFALRTKDGCFPFGTPAMDPAGNLYGATEECGSSNLGVLWKVSKAGKETVLHNFAGGASDGSYPLADVYRDAKGNLYGNTEEGGTFGYGTVYKLSTSGALTLVHSFSYSSDGGYPYASLVRDTQGEFYGTATVGGSGGYGTVWELTPVATRAGAQ
jgi:uncharacterized repeat protein (TIGR03803 family)